MSLERRLCWKSYKRKREGGDENAEPRSSFLLFFWIAAEGRKRGTSVQEDRSRFLEQGPQDLDLGGSSGGGLKTYGLRKDPPSFEISVNYETGSPSLDQHTRRTNPRLLPRWSTLLPPPTSKSARTLPRGLLSIASNSSRRVVLLLLLLLRRRSTDPSN